MKKTALWLLIAAIFTASNVNAQTANPSNLTNLNGVLYYTTSTTAEGTELWKTDGTAAGTMLVKDIAPGATGSNPQYLTAMGSSLYFTADDGVSGIELWKTDGTTAGTVMVKDIRASGSADPRYLFANNGFLYFGANDGVNGLELWKSDGTSAGTALLKNIDLISSGSLFTNPYFTVMGTDVYFRAQVGSPYELWKTDGTTTGTVKVSATAHYTFGAIVRAGNTIFFVSTANGTGNELWKSDGTAAGTGLLKEINPSSDAYPSEFAVLGNTLIFSADNGTNGTELWKSDGTSAGTVMVTDIYPGSGSGSPSKTVAMNGNVYFTSYGNYATWGDVELWKSDGTAAGTMLVKNIRPSADSYPSLLTPVGNTLYFRANDGTNGFELFKSDGTAAGTELVKNINPGANTSSPENLTAVGSLLYFKADDGTNGIELWKSDGTTAGTVMVKDVVTPTILTGSVASPVCAGANFNLPYTLTGTYSAGNVFTAQLSDASGSFAAPVSIGTVSATAAGNISVTIPVATVAGTGYRIRILSSTPAVTGNDNGTDITINAAPVASVTAPSGSFCSGGSLLLTSSTGTSYVWKKDGTTITGATAQTYSATTAGSYTVTVTNSNGCSATSAPFVVTVTTVTAAITAAGNSFCQGGSLLLTSSVGDSYQWKNSGVDITGATSQTYSATAAGSYSVAVTTSGCSATSAAYAVTVTPSTVISTQPSNLTVCQLNAANFSVTATGTGLTYQWRKNSVAIAGATNASYSIASTTPADAGSYDVVVTGTCGAVTSSAVVLTVNTCTAVSNINPEVESALLMPSLVKNKTSLRISVRTAMKVDFVISDANGRQVMTISKQLNTGRNDISLELNQLAPGSYFINGNSSKGKIPTLKFVKQ
jgi:ELWxxDGT repeat protein